MRRLVSSRLYSRRSTPAAAASGCAPVRTAAEAYLPIGGLGFDGPARLPAAGMMSRFGSVRIRLLGSRPAGEVAVVAGVEVELARVLRTRIAGARGCRRSLDCCCRFV